MTRVIWAPQAIQDVEAIRAYVARDSARYADLVVERIIAAVERLENNPRSGRIVPEVGDESRHHGIRGRRHDDGDRLGRLLCRLDRLRTACHDDVHLETDQLGREAREPVVMLPCPPELDDDVLPFHIAQLAQALVEGLKVTRDSWIRRGGRGEEADAGEVCRRLGLAGERYHEHGEKHDENSGHERGGEHEPGAS